MKKRKLPIKIFHSFEEADAQSLNDFLAMKPEERVLMVNVIRRRIYKLKNIEANNMVIRRISYAKRSS